MAIQYAPLFALETQFQTKDGRNNTGGWLKVFLAATDDPATTYSDYNGTRNPEKIVLDDDGRAVVICDKSKAYRLEVYSIDGTLLWTEEPVYCSGTGGGGVSITKVVSTDGSISIDKSVAGSTTTYDIGLAPNDSDEFLEWIKCSEKDCGATWYPVFNDGSMETEAGKGIKVHKGHLYHFTNSFTVDPDGTGVNYDTFRVAMYCGDDIVDEHDFDIDSSLNDQVLCEFSRDVVPSKDTHVYFKLTIPATCKASGEVQCHRIYSGINAVPDTCATKQWVSASYQPLSGMSAYVPYSSIGNNSMGQVTGINGSAIAGGLDSASVSSIASSVASAYTESAFSSLSSKADSSALSAYQPVSAMGAYATTAYVDSSVSGKLDTTAFNSGDFYPTSNPSGYITGVDLTPYQEKSAMTAYQPSGDYYSASNPSGFITGVDLSDYATTGFVESAVSGKLDTTAFNPGDFYTTANESGFVGRAYVDSSVSGKLDTSAFASASAGFQPTGDYAFNSSLSSYIPASASGAFQPSGDYAFNSAVSSKLDASASSNFVVNSAMTSWIPYSALDYSGTAISGIGGSSLAGMGGGADYTGIYPVNVDNDAREISVDSLPLVTDSSMTAYVSAGSSVIGVNMDILSAKQDTLAFAYNTADQISSINGSALGGMDEAAVSGIASAYAQSAASSKLDKTAQVVTATGSASAEEYGSWPLTTSYLVSSINGSALLPYGYSELSRNSAKWNNTYTVVTANSSQWISVYNTVNSNSASWSGSTGGGSVVSPNGTILVTNGNEIEGTNSAVYTASSEGGEGFTSLLTPNTGTMGTDMELLTTGTVPGTGATLSIPLPDTWTNIRITLSGRDSNYNYASASGLVTAHNTIAVIPMGVITGEISASADQWFNLRTGEMLTAQRDGGIIITTDVAELAWKSAVDNVTNTVATNSASWGQGGVSPVTVSSIASSYAESAASSKLDTTAFNSADFYSTSNPSGFITGVDLTPYQPTSAMSAYATTAYVESGLSGKENVFSAGTGLEFVQSGSDRVLQVEAPVDIVAGPGIVIDNPDGNTLRVSVAHLGDWEDVTSEITKSTTIITGGSITFRYNKAMKMISLIGEIRVQGAGDVYTLPEKYRPQTNFTCSNPGATSYIDYTPSNGKFVARSGANGYFSWTMTMPCLGE